jgi:hypothetical protein
MCEYSLKDQDMSSPQDFIVGFITNNFKLIYVPNKVPDLPNEKDEWRQTGHDHEHQDFWTYILAWETSRKEDQDK